MSKIDYSKRRIFKHTQEYLARHYRPEVIAKFGNQLALLFQNGMVLNANTLKDVDEALWLFNYIEDWDDFNDAKKEGVSEGIGNKIIAEEVYDILVNTKWAAEETTSTSLILKKAGFRYEEMKETVSTLEDLFLSDDLSIKESVKNFKDNHQELWNDFTKLLTKAARLVDEMPKVKFNAELERIDVEYVGEQASRMTLLIVFEKLRYVLFRINTIYQKMVSDRPDTLNQSLADNLNFELYGSSGGFNPNTKVIKTCMGSAVDELRVASALNLSLPRAKIRFDSFVKDILDDNDITEKNIATQWFDDPVDRENMQYLLNYKRGQVKDVEKARNIVITIKLAGVITLLTLKHEVYNGMNDGKRERIENELENIKLFCKI